MASVGQAAILPTNLEPTVGANYQPAGSDERDIWQSLERVESEASEALNRYLAMKPDAPDAAMIRFTLTR